MTIRISQYRVPCGEISHTYLERLREAVAGIAGAGVRELITLRCYASLRRRGSSTVRGRNYADRSLASAVLTGSIGIVAIDWRCEVIRASWWAKAWRPIRHADSVGRVQYLRRTEILSG